MKKTALLACLLLTLPPCVFAKGKKNTTPEHIVIIEPDIKDRRVRRELDKLVRPPKRELFFDIGINMFTQETSMLRQEWKWYESTTSTATVTREDVLDTRILMTTPMEGREYTLNAGYNFHRYFGFGINLAMPLFPFIERDTNNVLPVFRIDTYPYFLVGLDLGQLVNLSLALGPHIGYYHYKQITDNPNAFNLGLMVMETKLLSFGLEVMPQIRFNIGPHFYAGVRAQIIYDPASAPPDVTASGYLPIPSGTRNEYNYYFFSNFNVKGGLFLGYSLRNTELYRAKPAKPPPKKPAEEESNP